MTAIDAKTALINKLRQPSVSKILDDVSPKDMGADFFISSMISVFQADPKVAACTPASLIRCAYLAAKLGLPLGENGVYLVPRKPHRDANYKEATPVVHYLALIEMALQHPKVDAVHAATVREGDTFSNNVGDLTNPIHHEIPLQGRGKLQGSWAIVVESGNRTATVLPADEVLACRPQYYKSTPWGQASTEGEMWRKTAIRRALKTAPKSSRLRMALAAEDAVDAGDNTAGVVLDLPADLEKPPGSAPVAKTPPPLPDPLEPGETYVSDGQQTKPQRVDHLNQPAAAPAPIKGAPVYQGGQVARPDPDVFHTDAELEEIKSAGVKVNRTAEEITTDRSPPPAAQATATGNVAAEVGKLMAEMDDAALQDDSVNDRFRTALSEIAGGALPNVTTMEQVNALRNAVFGG